MNLKVVIDLGVTLTNKISWKYISSKEKLPKQTTVAYSCIKTQERTISKCNPETKLKCYLS